MDYSAFIKEWLSAWTGAGDARAAEKLLHFYHDEVFYADPAVRDGIRGKEELSQYFGRLLKRNPHWVWEAEELIPTPAGCTLKWKARIPVNGDEITEYGLDILEIRDGRISRNEVFFDRLNWLSKLQQS